VKKPTLEEGLTISKEVGAAGSVSIEEILKKPQEVKSKCNENFAELYNSGNILAPKMHCKNIIFISNTKDSMQRGGKSHMVSDLINTLLKRLDRQTLSIQFPDVISQLHEQVSTSFEMSCSNTIMPLKLFYSHNIVTKTYAAIFVNTHTRELEWDKAVEKGEACRHLFERTLEFDQVEVFTNLAKFRMIEVFGKI
jgi:hypothetical protein